jgi:hypothetical protein
MVTRSRASSSILELMNARRRRLPIFGVTSEHAASAQETAGAGGPGASPSPDAGGMSGFPAFAEPSRDRLRALEGRGKIFVDDDRISHPSLIHSSGVAS